MSFTYRDVTVYRPYADEVPWDMLDGAVPIDVDLDLMRVAKYDGEVVGAYVMERDDILVFRIIAIVVAEPYRGRFIGRWLLGHALGVAESKGGRVVLVPTQRARRFFEAVGFVPDRDGLRLDLTPE